MPHPVSESIEKIDRLIEAMGLTGITLSVVHGINTSTITMLFMSREDAKTFGQCLREYRNNGLGFQEITLRKSPSGSWRMTADWPRQ